MIMLAATLAAIAIVTQDSVPLRAAPRDSAQQQAVLWQGDSLEIRGTKGDFLQVYDHRRERAGYVRITQVRKQSLTPADAPELMAVVRFLRDTPGAEALGTRYAAAYLRAAPAEAIDGEIFDALGTFADRLARRASSRQVAAGDGAAATRPGKAGDAALAAHLEVVAHYGVGMTSFDQGGQVRICYNGDAFRRVLALPATDVQKAEAALALTRHECVAPNLTPLERFNVDNWRAEVLERARTQDLPGVLKNRLHLRKAGVLASLAIQHARRPESGAEKSREAAEHAIDELAAVDKSALMETDISAVNDAAVRVGASRWAAEPSPPAKSGKPTKPAKLAIRTTAGQPGETCIHLVDAKHGEDAPLLTRCTYSVVWSNSATVAADGNALALAVQPMDTWREMWVFKNGPQGWHVDVLPPAPDNPGLGYVEFAGWVPGSKEMLAVREARVEGRFKQSFEVLDIGTLATRKQADKPNNLSTFYRWQSPVWKAGTVALR